MIKHIVFFSITSFLISCHEQTAHPDYTTLIKGDWIGQADNAEYAHDKTIHISFEDSTCNGYFWPYSQYQILHDTVYIKGLDDHARSRYTILQLTAYSLTLRAAKHDSDNYIPDTIIFTKIKAKNNISPSAVYFASSGCFGTCPIIYLEIDSSRHVKFYGERYTSITGGYSGTITKSQYNIILDKNRNIPLSSLKPYYEAPWTDDQTRGIAIVNGDSIIKTAAYGSAEEPLELDLLLSKLEYSFETRQLHPDSTVTPKYFSTHPQNTSINSVIFPPRVLAPSKFTPPKIVK
jgi:hypothetical protein